MIGIFDSGLGGLTALKELRALAPETEIVYFGDTGRVPYGTRSAETIRKYAFQDASFLLSTGVDMILVACGTASTAALGDLKRALPVPVVGVVEPAAEAAVKATRSGKIAVIGTAATIRTGAFDAAVKALSPEIKVVSRACPLFVSLVEAGFTGPGCEITRLACEHYLSDIKESGADTLILGCTHYPLIAETIASVLPGVTLISAGAEAARTVAALVKKPDGAPGRPAAVHYFVSDDPALFTASAAAFLGSDIRDRVEKIDIDRL